MLQASITWKQCASKLPAQLMGGNAIVMDGKVYYGGVNSFAECDEYIVYCYDPPRDKWTTLPPLPVKWFGLGQVNGKLVAVGGRKRIDNRTINEIYTLDERSQKQRIPPMPTARHLPRVLSLQSALVVAGGVTPSESITDAVEIFKPDTSQWYWTDPLPAGCHSMALISIGSTHLTLGGDEHPSNLNQALYASVDDLICNAVPANQITQSGSSDTQSAWKTQPNTPTYQPAAAVLAGNLLAVGGCETSKGGADKKKVYMYSPSTNSWLYVSDLPASRSNAAVAVLSSTEILVIGGWDDGDRS